MVVIITTSSNSEIPVPITDAYFRYGTDPTTDSDSEEKYKYAKYLILIPFIIVFIWAIINSFILTSFYRYRLFTYLLVGSVVVIPFSMVMCCFIFLYYKYFGTLNFFISLILYNTLTILIVVQVPSERTDIFWSFFSIVTLIAMDIYSIRTLFNIRVYNLLFNISYCEFYKVKFYILKYCGYDFFLAIVGIYYSTVFSVITLVSLTTSEYNSDDFCSYYTFLFTFISWLFCIGVSIFPNYEKLTFVGILLGIHAGRLKGKVTLNSKRSYKHDFLEDFKNKRLMQLFGLYNKEAFDIKYGKEDLVYYEKRELQITSDTVKKVENGSYSPYHIITSGAFIYSLLYEFDVKTAIIMSLSASYSSGYLRAISGNQLSKFGGLKAIIDGLNVAILLTSPFFLFKTFYEIQEIKDFTITGIVTLLGFVITSTMLLFCVFIIAGYSKVVVCKFIEDPNDIISNTEYGRYLKKYMGSIKEKKIL